MNRTLSLILSACSLALCMTNAVAMEALPLPAGVKAVWDVDKAWKETTATHERICLNGLWAWQPGKPEDTVAPAANWGALKVPAPWPGGGGGYTYQENQAIYRHPSWAADLNPSAVNAAWYQREFTVPKNWDGRKISLTAEYINSLAILQLDGKPAGELRFPCGELDITALCKPGTTHVLSILVLPIPLNALVIANTDTNSAKVMVGNVGLRGLVGDVYLVGVPKNGSVGDVKIDTSVRKGEISLDVRLDDIEPAASYALRVGITEKDAKVKEFTSKPFKGDEVKAGRITITERWKADKLWDTHTPQNMYHLQATLLDAKGKVVDAFAPIRFGYREFYIDGKDFYLNGSRIFLSSVPLDNGLTGIADATYERAKESMLRLKSFGMNFLYTHNYWASPGSFVAQREMLRAADDVGMLISLSQPHMNDYKWEAADADTSNNYAKHAEFFVRVAQDHPSVICYSTSHNAHGCDDNPDHLDGRGERAGVEKALRVGVIINKIDPTRFVYHHAGGNLGAMITSNWYPNWTPAQELSDWFEHWSTKSVKPYFSCEYGAPLTWDFTMYRGWFNNKREFGSARVPWELCVAEWCSQFWGDRAFKITDLEKDCLRMESTRMRAGKPGWPHWEYPKECVSSNKFSERMSIFGDYYQDNFRAYRTWGLSATSPWEHTILFDMREGVDRNALTELKTDWETLQRPGYSPDFIQIRFDCQRMDIAYERTDWIPNAGGKALIRNNQPLLAYIGGKAAAFTSKDHNFLPGETVDKQLIIINNSRITSECVASWSLALPKAVTGTKTVSIKTGEQERIPLSFELPAGLKAGAYAITASVKFSNGDAQEDTFTINVLAPAPAVKVAAKIALFDPKGETGAWLKAKGVAAQAVDAKADLAGFDLLIIGKQALTVGDEGPDVSRVRDGLRVLIFEQESQVLEKRFGFRVQEYGLRNVVIRTPDHPILAGLEAGNLRDWRGSATIVPQRVTLQGGSRGEGIKWCDIDVSRHFRCGNRGNVATVLIERPASGDFLSLIDGGFSLQYSPLMEYREGKGLIVFCQLDVSGRTESDPAADALTGSILRHVAEWKASPRATALYAGDAAGKTHLEKTGVALKEYEGGALTAEQVLIVGPNGSQKLAAHAAPIAAWLKAGGKLLAIGLDDSQANAFLPFKITTTKAEHISSFFATPTLASGLAGVGPADVHNRDPREVPLVTGGAKTWGNGVLARSEETGVVFFQLVPWEFVYTVPQNIKRTFRRTTCAVSRLLGNMGVEMATPLLERIKTPAGNSEKRFLNGFYLDIPEEWDDPYRYFGW